MYLFNLIFLSFFLSQYELLVEAKDGRKENFTTVIVHVKDVNDHPPIFEKTSYRTQITEEDDRGLPKKVMKVSLIILSHFYGFISIFIIVFIVGFCTGVISRMLVFPRWVCRLSTFNTCVFFQCRTLKLFILL